jgi:hypothetical protein
MWHDRLQVYHLCRSVRTERFRLSLYQDPNGDTLYTELFDYSTDPDEMCNLAALPEHRSTFAELTGIIRSGWSAFRPPS